MSPTRAKRLGWGLAALALTLQVVSHVLAAFAGVEFVVQDLFVTAIAFAFGTVGALVATRHPGNPIGWIFLGVAISTGLGGLAHGFAEYELQDGAAPSTLVGAAAAYADTSWVPFILVPATVLLLLFPDGRPPSRRWRFVGWSAVGGIAGVLFTGMVGSESIADFPGVKNPLVIDSPVMEPLMGLSGLLLLVGLFGSAASVVVRFRRAGHVERQQLKWLATAGSVVAVTVPIVGIAFYDALGAKLADATMMIAVLGLPLSAGIAMLRYRLYDIDVVINRTLVYGALTATLAAVYLGSVLLLQLGLDSFTKGSALPVAASTLAVAAAFRPARGRIQGGVDRRFYRRKYDAQRTLASFSAHLRDEVDLAALDAELRAVVAETMQPAHVSLWMRERVQ